MLAGSHFEFSLVGVVVAASTLVPFRLSPGQLLRVSDTSVPRIVVAAACWAWAFVSRCGPFGQERFMARGGMIFCEKVK